MSDGARPLPAATYYARLGQRLVSALTAKTAEGQLYEIDMRLRPSGNAGPVATTLDNFTRYHADSAQTWEQQALTRARVVAGDAGLAPRVEDAIWAQSRPAARGPERWARRSGRCASGSSRSTAATIPGSSSMRAAPWSRSSSPCST